MRTRKRKRVLLFLCGLVLLLAIAVAGLCYWSHQRGTQSVSISAVQEYAPENVTYFYQKSPKWQADALGDSKYTMADSGCLTCCVASVLQMQKIAVSGLASDADAGAVNRFFSENGVYDSEGNLLWEKLSQVTGKTVVKKDASELAEGELDELLASGVYPIVRVRVGGVGNYHYVLLVESQDGAFWCMDPLEETPKAVPLSDFGDKIYAVRYLQAE